MSMVVLHTGLVGVASVGFCMVAGTGVFGELAFWAVGEVEVELCGNDFCVWCHPDLKDDGGDDLTRCVEEALAFGR